VELTGFEPVTPSLRKMRSNGCDKGKRTTFSVLWSGCGASYVKRGESVSVRLRFIVARSGGMP